MKRDLQSLGKYLIAMVLMAAACYAAEDGFVPLFDGKSLNGWVKVAGKGNYLVEDGKIVCPADADPVLFTEKDYSDFVLRFEFRMDEPGANNGIGIRVPSGGWASKDGMEIQILDDSAERYRGKIKPEQYHGSVYGVIPARTGFLKPIGEWNEQEISAVGRRIRVTLNGVIIVDSDLSIVKEPKVLEQHPGVLRTTGRIGLLGHGSHVEFRNLRIRTLDSDAK